MLRQLLLPALAVSAALTPAAAQGVRHPLVGRWNVTVNASAAPSYPAVLTVAQRGDQLMATLELPAADRRVREVQKLRGVVVGDEATFTYVLPSQQRVQWTVAAHGTTLVGRQVTADVKRSALSPAELQGTRSN